MDNPISVPLPKNLPTNWAYGQTVAPNGSDAGLAEQYGYNYLMEQVNAAQQAAEDVGEAIPGLVPTSEVGQPNGVASLGSDGKVPAGQLPDMNYDPAGSAASVQKNLEAHTGDRNNPHSVTAQQVGADPAGTGAAVQQALNSHTANRSNPHGVTIDQIGADRGWTLIGSVSVSVRGDYAINSAAEYDSIKMVFEIQSFQALQTYPFELQGTSSASLVIIKNGSYDDGITPVNKKCVFQSTQSSVFTSTKGESRYFERYYFIPGSDSIPYSNSSANISAVVFDGQNYKFSFGAQGSSDTVNMTVKLYGKNEG